MSVDLYMSDEMDANTQDVIINPVTKLKTRVTSLQELVEHTFV